VGPAWRGGALGRGAPGAGGRDCCCCKRASTSGLGGTTGRADGWPTRRVLAGRGAIGAPGVRLAGRAGGAGRGMGEPGTADAEGAVPGSITWVGGMAMERPGWFGRAIDGAAWAGGAPGEAGRGGREGRCGTEGALRCRSGGSGCLGPVGAKPVGAKPGRTGGIGRAGTDTFRFDTPGPDCGVGANGGWIAPPA
jgi:hypothetical protein